jgi:hypothetical protein
MGEAQGKKMVYKHSPEGLPAGRQGLNNELVCPATDRFYIIWFSVQKIVKKLSFRNIPENFMPI